MLEFKTIEELKLNPKLLELIKKITAILSIIKTLLFLVFISIPPMFI